MIIKKLNLLNYLKAICHELIIISDGADWVIDNVSFNLNQFLNKKGVHSVVITKSSILERHRIFKNKIFYFIDRWAYLDLKKEKIFKEISKHNKIIVTWWHSSSGKQNRALIQSIETLKHLLPYFAFVLVTCTQEYSLLIKEGIPAEKLLIIPEGIEDFFRYPSLEEKVLIRNKLNIPKDAFCIGCFQKDGIGWQEGSEPKLDKGPDIFIEVIGRLARKYINLFVLLTGPARGYVKQKLNDIGIPFAHKFLSDYKLIVDYYGALDLYLITSRTEGGPKAVLEAMACGVPVVSTRVGMCNDIIKNDINGFLCNIDDIEDLCKKSESLIINRDLREYFSKNAKKTVINYSWDKVSDMVIEKCISLA